MKWFAKIWDLLFPKECTFCSQKGSFLCSACISTLTHAKESNHPWITSSYDYRDPRVEQLMRIIKNKPHYPLLKKIIPKEILVRRDYDMIIPIPIHHSRFIERGFNQAKLIGSVITQRTNIPLKSDLLIKTKKTPKQGTSETKALRLQNVIGSFSVRNHRKIRGKKILLVDDITTTGATLSEARNTLLAQGASLVDAYTVVN